MAAHTRCFGWEQLICTPWHYLPVLEKKPGALRNGAPFQDWDLPVAIQRVRGHLLQQPKGDRAFANLLLAARESGVEPLAVACELVLEQGDITAPVILSEPRRLTAPVIPAEIALPDQLRLATGPLADCSRYDHLTSGIRYVH